MLYNETTFAETGGLDGFFREGILWLIGCPTCASGWNTSKSIRRKRQKAPFIRRKFPSKLNQFFHLLGYASVKKIRGTDSYNNSIWNAKSGHYLFFGSDKERLFLSPHYLLTYDRKQNFKRKRKEPDFHPALPCLQITKFVNCDVKLRVELCTTDPLRIMHLMYQMKPLWREHAKVGWVWRVSLLRRKLQIAGAYIFCCCFLRLLK